MRRFAFLLAVCCFTHASRNANAQKAPAAPRPVLVELFTSEGCSDCPPADALLRRLQNTRTPQGQPVFALSEHVTYWDRLGWKDRFSDETFTARQNDYAQRFSLDSVYTPQMVVDGTKQFVGNDSGRLRDVLLAEALRPGIGLRVVSTVRDPDGLTIHLQTSSAGDDKALDFFAAITDDLDETRVRSGENSGRTLTHVSVARSLTRIVAAREPIDRVIRIPWPSELKHEPETPRHLLVFAQKHSSREVQDAVSVPIPAAGDHGPEPETTPAISAK